MTNQENALRPETTAHESRYAKIGYTLGAQAAVNGEERDPEADPRFQRYVEENPDHDLGHEDMRAGWLRGYDMEVKTAYYDFEARRAARRAELAR